LAKRKKKPRYFPRDVVDQADLVLNSWKKHRNEVDVNGLSIQELETELCDVKKLDNKMFRLQREIKEMRKESLLVKRELYEKLQKVRNSARAAFGLNDVRLTQFGLKPGVKRGRPSKTKTGKQLPLELEE